MGKPVRMADIAQQLGISVVSVSKALSGKPGVSEEMRGKVVALAREMGYEGVRSHGEAGGTGNIGVLVADRFFEENAFYTGLYRSLVLASSREDLACMIEILSQEAELAAQPPALITGRKVDGLIFMGNLDSRYIQTATAGGIPCVLLDFSVPNCGLDCVVSDNLDGGYALTKFLLERGMRSIGFVGSIRATTSIMARYLGYQRALRMAGLVPREEWLLEDRDRWGAFIPLELPAELPRAFLCSCDETAYNLVERLRSRGVRVPEDVAVCGYDDYRFSTLCQPQLTTYRVDLDRLADTAVKRLCQRLREGPQDPISLSISGQIVVRESTG